MASNNKKCQFCGRYNDDTAKICGFCNHELPEKIDSENAISLKTGLINYIVTPIGGFLAIFLIGWLYIWLNEIPYVGYFGPIIYGGVIGLIIIGILYRQKCFNIKLKNFYIAIGFVIAVYANWVWSINHFFDVFTLNISQLLDGIDILQDKRVFVIEGLKFKGVWVSIIWFFEILFILGGEILIFSAIIKERLYCPWCKDFKDTETTEWIFEIPDKLNSVVANLKRVISCLCSI